MNRSTKWESDRSLCVVVSDEQLKAMFYGQRRRTFTRADSRAGNYSVLVASQNSYCVSECAHTCNAADLWQRRQAARKKRAEENSSYVRAIGKTGRQAADRGMVPDPQHRCVKRRVLRDQQRPPFAFLEHFPGKHSAGSST